MDDDELAVTLEDLVRAGEAEVMVGEDGVRRFRLTASGEASALALVRDMKKTAAGRLEIEALKRAARATLRARRACRR